MKISLNITENRYDIPLGSLFKIAARKNAKRNFLFVSKIIGKHIPIYPETLRIAGAVLARLWLEDNEGVKCSHMDILVEALNNKEKIPEALKIIEKPLALKTSTLFIGFAETATGIGQAVYENFTNSGFIHTTRENIKTIKPGLFFLEEHSHATDHLMFPREENFLSRFQHIVLIDDEITTGKTALNLIKKLPEKTFSLISILDWRDEESLNMFREKGNIKVSSLIRGTVHSQSTCDRDFDPMEEISPADGVEVKDIVFPLDSAIEGYSLLTGRFGITSSRNSEIYETADKIAEVLNKERIEGNCLCMGNGEFIYLPCLISSKLKKTVYFQSASRSPIYARPGEDYGINNKVVFPSPSDERVNYHIYNLPYDFYKQAIFFSEHPLSSARKEELKNIFGHFNIKSIIFVSWEGRK